jgi:hypothetical protein
LKKARRDSLTQQEQKSVRFAVRQEPHRSRIALALGLRAGEVFNTASQTLQWSKP